MGTSARTLARAGAAVGMWGLMLAGVVAGAAGTPQALSEPMQQVCRRAGSLAFVPAGPKVRLPADPLLAAIARTDDPQELKNALGRSDPDERRGDHGTTALVFAVWQGNAAAVRMLLEAGANVERTTARAQTPLGVALEMPQGALACQLIAHGARVPAPSPSTAHWVPMAAAIEPSQDAQAFVNYLLEQGYDIDARLAPLGETALHVAAGTGNEALVRDLIRRGADMRVRTRSGQTAEEAARQGGHRALARRLAQEAGRGEPAGSRLPSTPTHRHRQTQDGGTE